MYLLGIDLETTGLDHEVDEIIEVGAVIWDTRTNQPLEMFSKLIAVGNRLLPQKIVDLTGIQDKQLKDFGQPLGNVLEELSLLESKCDFLVAHNAIQFERKFLNQSLKKIGKSNYKKKWIDTTIDIDYPSEIKTRKLSYLAAEHKFLSTNIHRALFDVMTMFQILAKYDIKEICERANSDLLVVIAQVSFENKSLASDNGFKWDAFDKSWFKVMRQFDLDKAKFPFSVSITKVDFSK